MKLESPVAPNQRAHSIRGPSKGERHMTIDASDWHQALAPITEAFVRGEQRVTTRQLLSEYLRIIPLIVRSAS